MSIEDVASEVEETVAAFDLDDSNQRAGRQRWGYVEPSEAAWEILDEAMGPFLEDMKRRMELGHETEALEICKGVVLALYRAKQGKDGELAGWTPDFPAEAAATAVETFLKGPDRSKERGDSATQRRRPAFLEDFVSQSVPEWRNLIARIVSEEGQP